jgi:hypothetical protein
MKNLNPSRKEEAHQIQRKRIRVIFSVIIVRNEVTMLLIVNPRKQRILMMKQS